MEEKIDSAMLLYSAMENNDTEKIQVEILRLILSTCDLSEDNIDSDRKSYLFFTACQIGDIEFLNRWRSRFGPCFNLRKYRNETPLHHAVQFICNAKDCKFISHLLYGGANPNASDNEGSTALHRMASAILDKELSSLPKPIIYLLTKAGADINARDSKGKTPLHYSVNLKSPYNCIYDLLRFGADVNKEDNDGKTILDYIYEELESKDLLENFESRQVSEDEKLLYESFSILLNHLVKQLILKIRLSIKVEHLIVKLFWLRCMNGANIQYSEKYLRDGNIQRAPIMVSNFAAERQKLENTKLDGKTSMYNMISETHHRMSQLVKREVFRSYFELGNYKKDFPYLYYFLEQQYNAGIVRNILRPFAEDSMRCLSFSLPVVCLDLIFENFTNNELREFIETVHSLFPKQCENDTELSVLLLQSNTFNLNVLNIKDSN